MSTECAQRSGSCGMESDLRSEGSLGPGPTFLHSTLTQYGTRRNSRTLYLNLAVNFVMKVYLSVQGDGTYFI